MLGGGYLKVGHFGCDGNGCQNRTIPTQLVTKIRCQCRLVCVLYSLGMVLERTHHTG